MEIDEFAKNPPVDTSWGDGAGSGPGSTDGYCFCSGPGSGGGHLSGRGFGGGRGAGSGNLFARGSSGGFEVHFEV